MNEQPCTKCGAKADPYYNRGAATIWLCESCNKPWYNKLGATAYNCCHCARPSISLRMGYVDGHKGVAAAGLCQYCWDLFNAEEEQA